MRVEIAILIIGLIAIALKLYVTSFHEGILVHYEIKPVLLGSIVFAATIWVLRRLPLVDSALRILEFNPKDE